MCSSCIIYTPASGRSELPARRTTHENERISPYVSKQKTYDAHRVHRRLKVRPLQYLDITPNVGHRWRLWEPLPVNVGDVGDVVERLGTKRFKRAAFWPEAICTIKWMRETTTVGFKKLH